MPLLKKGKSKKEKEMERKIKVRQAKSKIQNYIKKCQKQYDLYRKHAVEANKLGNDALLKRFATKMVALENQIEKAQTVHLILVDIELSKEQVHMTQEFFSAISGMKESLMSEEITAEDLTEAALNIEAATDKAERIDEMLSSFAETLSDRILTSADVSIEDIESTLEKIDAQAASEEAKVVDEKVEESDLDRRIKEGLNKIKNLE